MNRPAPLDATQKALMAQLESIREVWQTTSPYNAASPQDPPARRRSAGVQIRKAVPHALHASWTAPKNRPGPVDIIVAGNAGRLEHLVPLRMGRMAVSPFTFSAAPPR